MVRRRAAPALALEVVTAGAVAVLVYVIAIGPVRWRIRRLDDPVGSRRGPCRGPAGSGGRRSRGPGPACAAGHRRPHRPMAGSHQELARPAAKRRARFFTRWSGSRRSGCRLVRRSDCGRPSTGFPDSTSSASRRGSPCSACCVWRCSPGSDSSGSRPSCRFAAADRGGRCCARCSSSNSRTSLWERRRTACSLPGGRLARSAAEAIQRRRGPVPTRTRAERNGGRPPTCSTRWRTGRRPSTATAACARRCTTSCSGSSACFPTSESLERLRRSESTTSSFTSTVPAGRVAGGGGATAAVRGRH